MTTASLTQDQPSPATTDGLPAESIRTLVGLIIRTNLADPESCRRALQCVAVLLSRLLFRYGRDRLNLLDYVGRRSESMAKQPSDRHASDPDEIYNLVTNRWLFVPAETDGEPFGSLATYRAFARHLDRLHQTNTFPSPLDSERAEAHVMQTLVELHLRWALQTQRTRRSAAWSRYTFHGPDACLTLLVPRRVPGQERRTYVERCAGPIRPGDPGEQQRVQAAIDAYAGPGLGFTIDEARDAGHGLERPDHAAIEAEDEARCVRFIDGLAEEKSATAHLQRDAIAALGPHGVRDLVGRVMSDVMADDYHPASVAADFGLSRSTMTRFAARHWRDDRTGLPSDLWLNAARLLGRNPLLIEAAKNAGLLDEVRRIAQAPEPPEAKHPREVRHA